MNNSLKYIAEGMFKGTSIEEIDIPQSVIHIGSAAFSGSQLKEVELPYNLYSIEQHAFNIPSLSKIIIHSNVKIIKEDIFGFPGKEARPTVYCSTDTEGFWYARKHRLNCIEIPSQPEVNVSTCVGGVVIELSHLNENEDLKEWYRYLGINKAETWSWNNRRWKQLHIEKCMDMAEFLRIKNIILKIWLLKGRWLCFERCWISAYDAYGKKVVYIIQ